MSTERAPSQRIVQHADDYEQPPLPAGATCAYGQHELSAIHGYMFYRGLWYCLHCFMRHGPLQR